MGHKDRSVRIDFWRGVALLLVFIGHCEAAAGQDVLNRISMWRWYWCDGAELFVFLSGLVCGTVYLRKLRRDGYRECQAKGLKRAWQLYLANLAVLIFIVGAAVCFEPDSDRTFLRLQYNGLEYGVEYVLPAAVAMLYQPLAVDVLTLYIQFLALLPIVLLAWTRYPRMTMLLCLLAYVEIQFVPEFNWPRWPHDDSYYLRHGRHFNHVAWNAFFLLGAFVAINPVDVSPSAKRLGFGLSLLVVVSILCVKNGFVQLAPIDSESIWLNKRMLGPLRVLAFLALAYVISVTVTEEFCRGLGRLVQPITLLGRNSLLIYSLGLVLTHATWWLVPESSSSPGLLVTYEAASIAIMLCAAMWWERAHPRGSRRTSESVTVAKCDGHEITKEPST